MTSEDTRVKGSHLSHAYIGTILILRGLGSQQISNLFIALVMRNSLKELNPHDMYLLSKSCPDARYHVTISILVCVASLQ